MVSQSYLSSSSSTTNPYSSQQERKKFKPPPPAPHFNSSLHSVRKLPTKILKMPIAPLPPTLPRVYKVDSSNFKQLVQKLTTAPEFQSPRLKSMAAPPLLSLSTPATSDTTAPEFQSPRLKSMAAPPLLSLSTTATSDTTAPEFQSPRLKSMAAPPLLSLSITATSDTTAPVSATYYESMSEKLDIQPWKESNTISTPVGFSQSPMSRAWSFDETLDTQPWKQSDNLATLSPAMGFGSQSPLSHPWFSFLL